VRRVALLHGEHRVDNVACCAALADACRGRGVTIREEFEARRVGVGSDSVTVEGPSGSVNARRLVLAAGAWSAQIAGLPPLPVRPVRGQMLRLEGAAWPWRGSARWRERYVVRRGNAGLLVGATVEEAGFAEHPTADGAAALLDFARTLFPRLSGARLESVWAGLRPGSPDGRPILGALDGGPVIAACGHYRNGILLAPWTGAVVAGIVAGEGALEQADLFSPDRFAAAAR
jgi:glycine oxidase